MGQGTLRSISAASSPSVRKSEQADHTQRDRLALSSLLVSPAPYPNAKLRRVIESLPPPRHGSRAKHESETDMRALVISDIHSNLQALEAVLAAAPKHDMVWNLGDIVGYGANPNEVVGVARKLGGIVVRGNHDRVCSGNIKFGEYRTLNSLASFAASWTQKTLSAANTEWLTRLPRGPVRPLGRKVACVHGSPRDEDEYMIFRGDVSAALYRRRAWLTLCGHTHWQAGWSLKGWEVTPLKPVFESSDRAEQFELKLHDGNRYLLNPGSVGQPRDRDWRAAFAVYDDAQASFTWFRVPYKVLAAQSRIRRAGLPEALASRLRGDA